MKKRSSHAEPLRSPSERNLKNNLHTEAQGHGEKGKALARYWILVVKYEIRNTKLEVLNTKQILITKCTNC